jgi:uncharacterized membrane protein
MRLLLRVLYWLAVLAISIVLLIVLVRFFESQDDSELDRSSRAKPPSAALDRR